VVMGITSRSLAWATSLGPLIAGSGCLFVVPSHLVGGAADLLGGRAVRVEVCHMIGQISFRGSLLRRSDRAHTVFRQADCDSGGSGRHTEYLGSGCPRRSAQDRAEGIFSSLVLDDARGEEGPGVFSPLIECGAAARISSKPVTIGPNPCARR